MMRTDGEQAEFSPEDTIRRRAVELLAVAQSGLTYVRDEFDRERYEQVRGAALSLLAMVTDASPTILRRVVTADGGHATPKVDVRGAVFDSRGQVLLVRERSNGLWTLPGGWCDVLESPSEAVQREVREEAGVSVEVVKLVAVLDRERQGHRPHLPFHVYKLFFLCRELERGEPDHKETLAVGWFLLDRLPDLCAARVLESQLQLAHSHLEDPQLPTVFD